MRLFRAGFIWLPLLAVLIGCSQIAVHFHPASPVVLPQSSLAIVVGISDYEAWPELPNAVRDIEEVSAALERLGFEVRMIADPDYRRLSQVLEELVSAQGAEENRVLFYFAGHGAYANQGDGERLGYIVPRDAPQMNAGIEAFRQKAISMRQIEEYTGQMHYRQALFVFDCVFGSLAPTSGESQHTSIARRQWAFPVRQFISSGGPGESVPDESVFKTTLLRALDGEGDANRDAYITGTELARYLAEKVAIYSGGTQHPQYSRREVVDAIQGEFVFAVQ